MDSDGILLPVLKLARRPVNMMERETVRAVAKPTADSWWSGSNIFTSRGIKAGDPKEKEIAAAKECMNKLLAAVGEYKNYTIKMNALNRYDHVIIIIAVAQLHFSFEVAILRHSSE